MNHGLINKVLYSGLVSNDQDLYEVYPELNLLRRYFAELNKRDRYYVAMKYHAIKVAKSIYPEIVLEQLAEIINVNNHATIFYYMNNYIPLEGHGKFISEYFNKFIQDQIYPLTTVYGKEREEHGLFKQITLEECREQYGESSSKEKKEKKRKRNSYVYAVKRNKAERY